MKRSYVLGSIVIVLAATAPSAARAAEQHTDDVGYRGYSDDLECRSTVSGQAVTKPACDGANAVAHETFTGPARFKPPSWARSVRISIRDDSGRAVGFIVAFDDDSAKEFRFANTSCAQHATLNLPAGTTRVSVARPHPGGRAACSGTHTTGLVRARFSSVATTRPSPRLYEGGCGVVAVATMPFGSTCSYTASTSGGYVAVGTWRITIVRGSKTIALEAIEDPPCAKTGFIRPGDHITAEIGLGAGLVRAGDDAHC